MTNEESVSAHDTRPLRSLFGWAIFVLFVLLLAYVASSAWVAFETDPQRQRTAEGVAVTVGNLGRGAWAFMSPLLQLIIVLVIVDWLLARLGIKIRPSTVVAEGGVQAVLALVVIGAFAIAALGGLSYGLGALKDVALVVVGFYFGTQRKVLEVDPTSGRVRQVETHENPVPSADAGAPPSPS